VDRDSTSFKDVVAENTRKAERRTNLSGDRDTIARWVFLAVSGGTIAAAFSGLFGAPENAQIALSGVGVLLVPLVSWFVGPRKS
jgi:hypothetical protein